MKKTLFSLIAVAITLPAFAQWTTSGTNIYSSYSGNVGIGGTSPTAGKLQIDAPDESTASAIAIRQSNSANYGFDFALDQNVDGRGYLYAVDNNVRTSLMEFARGTNILSLTASKVGVGTTAPHSLFHVSTGSGQAYNSDFGALSITPASDANKSLSFGYDTSLGANGSGWIQSIKSGAAYTPLLLNPNSGDVGIGTTDTKGYKLAVNGAAVATSMKVKLNTNWPDFVFLKDYKLPTLTEVKTYIDKNQHLPDMPTAAEVHANGLDLGEMNRLLLKKVEELTLYLIEKDEQLKDQEKINQLHHDQIDQLKVQINNILKSVPAK